jgi:UDP-glucuronate 4-epimerase
MVVLVTGCAGFIGYHLTNKLLMENHDIIGIDNINNYYDVKLKQDRLANLQKNSNFTFYQADISNRHHIEQILSNHLNIEKIVHLAAQAGVRYSLDQPFSYVESNIIGLLVILELCRNLKRFNHLIFASSSSVYGANNKVPFSVQDIINSPKSFYAASKHAGESMCYSYSSLYKLPITALRFFTVYGPWNRPDMAIHRFANAIFKGEQLDLYNFGKMRRDFTYIDDIVSGIVGAFKQNELLNKLEVPYKIYNLGNNKAIELEYFIKLLEQEIGKKANICLKPLQAGDMIETFADISETIKELGFYPQTSIEQGIKLFIDWYKYYYKSIS